GRGRCSRSDIYLPAQGAAVTSGTPGLPGFRWAARWIDLVSIRKLYVFYKRSAATKLLLIPGCYRIGTRHTRQKCRVRRKLTCVQGNFAHPPFRPLSVKACTK